MSKILKDGGYGNFAPVFPTASQIRTYTKNNKNTVHGEEEFITVNEFIRKLEYVSGTFNYSETDCFTFGCKYGTGSDLDHLIYNFTSRKFLRNLQDNNVEAFIRMYHIDGTHKCVANRFIVIVFGSSDINGHLHLISLSVFSHETEEDFKHFYFSLVQLCWNLNISFVPSFIMQDGANSSYNAAIDVFVNHNVAPSLIILMCWFHVKFNVKKKLDINNKYYIV